MNPMNCSPIVLVRWLVIAGLLVVTVAVTITGYRPSHARTPGGVTPAGLQALPRPVPAPGPQPPARHPALALAPPLATPPPAAQRAWAPRATGRPQGAHPAQDNRLATGISLATVLLAGALVIRLRVRRSRRDRRHTATATMGRQIDAGRSDRSTAAGYGHRRHARQPRKRVTGAALALVLATTLTGCAIGPLGATPAQSPSAYLDGVLAWYEAHSVAAGRVDWAVLRREARARAHGARTTAATYPAIRFALRRLGDRVAWLVPADTARCTTYSGWQLVYAWGQAVVAEVKQGSAAARAGMRPGDIVVSSNGLTPQQFLLTPYASTGDTDPCPSQVRLVLRRLGRATPLTITVTHVATWDGGDGVPAGRLLGHGRSAVGYLEMFADWGSGAESRVYPSRGQHEIQRLDQGGACGWVLDLRHMPGGDLWVYLAALGPLLGGGTVGGFVYADSHREPWAYRAGKVFWGTQERAAEDHLARAAYTPRHPDAPVALLVGPATVAAGELAALALQGRPRARTRLVGEPTAGVPLLQLATTLSDGAQLAAGGAYAYDRTGRVYRGPLLPDEAVATDWATVGTDRDPVLRAAVAWLRAQRGCTT